MAERPAEARADLPFGLFWTALGLGIVVESWRMDRLEAQGINPYTAPGLVPGLLGAVLAVFGLVLARRGLRGQSPGDEKASPLPAEEAPIRQAEPWRVALALTLCLGFGLGALGSGVPFPLPAGAFLFLAVFLFELPDRRRQGTVGRGVLSAAAIAGGAAGAITFVFQELFLVRLP